MDRRQPYVKPAVMQFDYEVDPRVTLAQTCKSSLVGSGPTASGCTDATSGGPCSDTPPS